MLTVRRAARRGLLPGEGTGRAGQRRPLAGGGYLAAERRGCPVQTAIQGTHEEGLQYQGGQQGGQTACWWGGAGRRGLGSGMCRTHRGTPEGYGKETLRPEVSLQTYSKQGFVPSHSKGFRGLAHCALPLPGIQHLRLLPLPQLAPVSALPAPSAELGKQIQSWGMPRRGCHGNRSDGTERPGISLTGAQPAAAS